MRNRLDKIFILSAVFGGIFVIWNFTLVSAENVLQNTEVGKDFKTENKNLSGIETSRIQDDEEIIVKFRKGATSAVYSEAVLRGERTNYILKASAGQKMRVRITSIENNAVFRIRQPNGQYLGRGTDSDGVRSSVVNLPVSGNYRVSVTSERGNATYRVTFAIR